MATDDEKKALLAKIEEMGQEKFAIALSRMSDEQRTFIADVIANAPREAIKLKTYLAARMKQDAKGIPHFFKGLFRTLADVGNLFDDEEGH